MERDRERGGSGRRVAPWLRLVPLVALWTVPVAAVALAVPAAGSREEASVAPDLPSVVAVGSQSADYRTSVNVSVEVEQLGQVRSPVPGLLTSLTEEDGPIRAGQELFAVDGVPVLAQPGTAPLHRELRPGDEGADVQVLGRFLVDAELLDEESAEGEEFGPGTRAAVVRLQEGLGVEADGVFRPSYVVYLPQAAGELGEPLMTVGSTVAAGEEVLATAPVPAGVTFAPASSGGSLSSLREAPLTLAFGEIGIEVSGLEPEPEELAEVYAGLREAVAAGDAQVTSGEPGGSGEPETYEGGLLGLAEPEERGVVPGTAVHITDSGEQCLFRQEQDGSWDPVPVPVLEAVVGTLGAVYVEPALVDTRIARDPLTLADDVLAECR